jgi:hypothetical protein
MSSEDSDTPSVDEDNEHMSRLQSIWKNIKQTKNIN